MLLTIDEEKLTQKLELIQKIVDDEELDAAVEPALSGNMKYVNTPKPVLCETRVDVTQKQLCEDITNKSLDTSTL